MLMMDQRGTIDVISLQCFLMVVSDSQISAAVACHFKGLLVHDKFPLEIPHNETHDQSIFSWKNFI